MGYLQSQVTATIAEGASLSVPVYLGDKSPVEIVMPAAWTAAALTFQRSGDGSTWTELEDDAGNAITYAGAAGRPISVSPGDFAGALYIKVRSGTSGTPVAQGAAREFTILKRRALPR